VTTGPKRSDTAGGSDPAGGEITRLLHAMERGDVASRDELLSRIYDELCAMARRQLAGERSDHTLETGALVHEAYLRLVDQTRSSWKNRGHFFAVASLVMRRILVNHARDRRRLKRGDGVVKMRLDTDPGVLAVDDPERLLLLDDLLARLDRVDADAARVVECRFFGGLTVEETSEAVGISATTVKRAWRAGRAWLRREMRSGGP
jgi:RNA polymerase sigma factor (TIGR02999 family)